MAERVFEKYRAEARPGYIGQLPQQDRLVEVSFYGLDPRSPKVLTATDPELELLPHLHSSRRVEAISVAEELGWSLSLTEHRRNTMVIRNRDLHMKTGENIEYLKKVACDLGVYAQGMLGIAEDLNAFMTEVYDEIYLIKRENLPDIRIVSLSARGQKGQICGPVTRSGSLNCNGLVFAPTELMGMYQSVGGNLANLKYPELIQKGEYSSVRERLMNKNGGSTYEMVCNQAARLKLLNPKTIGMLYERIQFAHVYTYHVDLKSLLTPSAVLVSS